MYGVKQLPINVSEISAHLTLEAVADVHIAPRHDRYLIGTLLIVSESDNGGQRKCARHRPHEKIAIF